MDSSVYVNQRRSYDGDLCTVRYVGSVQGTSGEWLGVEWDDPTRGKHSGEHKGVRYFTCKNKLGTAGSFVRPSRAVDQPRGFLEALREKYASEFEQVAGGAGNSVQGSIEISGKVVEEVGFDKIRRQLAELQELKVVILDGLRLEGVFSHGETQRNETCREIEQTCPKIIQLDLSRNLLSRWFEVADICGQLKRLKTLKLNGNRFGPIEEGLRFEGITELHLDETLLSWDEISALTYQFPSLTSLQASINQITVISRPISETITTLTLTDNEISSLSSLKHLASLRNLEHVSLRGNCVSAIHESGAQEPLRFSPSLKSIDISRNQINSWSIVNELLRVFPGLQSLRISGNPLYDQPVAPSSVTNLEEKPMTVDEAYMLTLARLPSLEVLNYGKISAQDRTNGELYYLSLIGKELSAYPETGEQRILAAHPQYKYLCEKYGEPVIRRATDSTKQGKTVNPRSVAARLVKMALHLSSPSDNTPREEVKEIPRSFNTYQVKAIVSRLFDLTPFGFRLIWETDELDPVSKETIAEDEWDSDDEGGNEVQQAAFDEDKFVKREVELVDSMRDIGFLFGDVEEAKIRIEVMT